MRYDPVNKMLVEDNKVEVKDSKTQDLEKPYFDPLYKDTRRAIVKEVEKYLTSKGYNNSTGKYDKVVFGVRSLLEKTLLQPGTDKFNDAVHKEADRLLKKYNLTNDSVKAVKRNVETPEEAIEYIAKQKRLDKQYIKPRYHKEKFYFSNTIGDDIAMYDTKEKKVVVYDSKTKDAFNKVDLKSIFGETDRKWLVAKKDIKNSLDKANTIQELEKMYDNMTYTDYSDIIEDYIDIWNEVGKYAQDKRRQCVNELSELRREVFKKLSKLDKEQK